MSEHFIELRQTPVIWYDNIKNISEKVQKRIAELNLDNQLVTEDTVKSVKATRTELNKEFAVFEEQRKLIKERVYEPYKEFENAYKESIAKHYENAGETLRIKISIFENQLKLDKEARLKDYFNELCQSKEIDFVSFERIGLKVTNSASDKLLKEQILKFVESVDKDITLLKSYPHSNDFKAEVLFEYKKTLDLSSSVRIVQEREKAKEEARKKAEENARPQVEEAKIIEETKEEPKQEEVLKAPAVEEPQKLYQTTFTVQGTMEQMKALKQFITDNNIQILK